MTNTMSMPMEGNSPLKTLTCIETVLRLYWSPNTFQADPKALEWLLDNGLIYPNGTWWTVSDRGKVYVEAIRNIPLPESVTEWRIPE